MLAVFSVFSPALARSDSADLGIFAFRGKGLYFNEFPLINEFPLDGKVF